MTQSNLLIKKAKNVGKKKMVVSLFINFFMGSIKLMGAYSRETLKEVYCRTAVTHSNKIIFYCSQTSEGEIPISSKR